MNKYRESLEALLYMYILYNNYYIDGHESVHKGIYLLGKERIHKKERMVPNDY